jgi:monofunctional glycosyltransferase
MPRPAAVLVRPRPLLRRAKSLVLWLLLVFLLLPGLVVCVYRFVAPPVTPLMLIRLAQGYGLRHEPMPLAEIAPALREAVIAAEDNLFCRHWGFDMEALRGQVEAWTEGRSPRGASTITMQTAKNLFLWPGRDVVRKLLEAWLTPQLELLWPKRRILETYLNIAEFGPGLYGAEAAARAFFGKSASRLSTREAALLAAVLPDPLDWNAGRPGPYLVRRAALLERRIGQLGPLLDCAE